MPKHELERSCPQGHLCVYADRNDAGEWLVSAARLDLNGKLDAGGNVLGFQPKERRRQRRQRYPAFDEEGTPLDWREGQAWADRVWPQWRVPVGTLIVFSCPDCGSPQSLKLA